MIREKLIYQVIGRVAVELPKSNKQSLREIEASLHDTLPEVHEIKEIYIRKGFICRSDVEKFMSNEIFPVRTTNLVAKAITKSLK